MIDVDLVVPERRIGMRGCAVQEIERPSRGLGAKTVTDMPGIDKKRLGNRVVECARGCTAACSYVDAGDWFGCQCCLGCRGRLGNSLW